MIAIIAPLNPNVQQIRNIIFYILDSSALVTPAAFASSQAIPRIVHQTDVGNNSAAEVIRGEHRKEAY